MYPTVEVRWFYKGQIPNSVMESYLRFEGKLEVQPPRFDIYLLLKKSDDLGIKLREGMLEIKQRTQRYGVHHFNPHAAGFIEAWRKWSFELAQFPHNLAGIAKRSEGWANVYKQRWLRCYQVTQENEVTYLPTGEKAENGCEWELSSVQVEGFESSWWSMAFEAYGDEHTLNDTLLRSATKITLELVGWDYHFEDSLSYPAWLGMVCKTLD